MGEYNEKCSILNIDIESGEPCHLFNFSRSGNCITLQSYFYGAYNGTSGIYNILKQEGADNTLCNWFFILDYALDSLDLCKDIPRTNLTFEKLPEISQAVYDVFKKCWSLRGAYRYSGTQERYYDTDRELLTKLLKVYDAFDFKDKEPRLYCNITGLPIYDGCDFLRIVTHSQFPVYCNVHSFVDGVEKNTSTILQNYKYSELKMSEHNLFDFAMLPEISYIILPIENRNKILEASKLLAGNEQLFLDSSVKLSYQEIKISDEANKLLREADLAYPVKPSNSTLILHQNSIGMFSNYSLSTCSFEKRVNFWFNYFLYHHITYPLAFFPYPSDKCNGNINSKDFWKVLKSAYSKICEKKSFFTNSDD